MIPVEGLAPIILAKLVQSSKLKNKALSFNQSVNPSLLEVHHSICLGSYSSFITASIKKVFYLKRFNEKNYFAMPVGFTVIRLP